METISIAAALRRAKRIKGQIAEHTTRATAAALYVEGKEPAFTFSTSVESRKALVKELLHIEVAVADANAKGTLSSGSVLHAIRRLAELKSEMAFYRALPVRAKEHDVEIEKERDYDTAIEKYVMVEKKTVHISAITQAKRASIVEALQLDFEKLNQELESFNHKTTVSV